MPSNRSSTLSDTPRTDAAKFVIDDEFIGRREVVWASDYQKLERELAAAVKDRDIWLVDSGKQNDALGRCIAVRDVAIGVWNQLAIIVGCTSPDGSVELEQVRNALKAKEEAERDVEQLEQSISLALTQMALAHKYPPEAAKDTLEEAMKP